MIKKYLSFVIQSATRNLLSGYRCFASLWMTILFFIFLQSCSNFNKKVNIPQGPWLGMITLDDKNPDAPIILPFNFEVEDSAGYPIFTIINAEERIMIKEIKIEGDSVIIQLPVFDSELACIYKDGMLTGRYFNRSKKKNNIAKFVAYSGMTERFKPKSKSVFDFSGKWDAFFNTSTDEAYKAIGEFKQNGHLLTGTFLTESGDFRFLQGIVDSNNFYLSCFDGSHAYLFTATQKADSTLAGYFYSIGRYDLWTAKRNENVTLIRPDSLTFIADSSQLFKLKFPNLSGKEISLTDERYKGKVLLVQVMGSWCPNCMDESRFLSQFYETRKSAGLEVISLAYERVPEFDKAVKNVMRVKQRFQINYEILIAGTFEKRELIAQALGLKKLNAFPTMFFIDKKGRVRKTYTGFNGPATGKHYNLFVKETNQFVDQLLAE